MSMLLRKLDSFLLNRMDRWILFLQRHGLRQRSFECVLVGFYIGFVPREFFHLPWILFVVVSWIVAVFQMSTTTAQRFLIIRGSPHMFYARMVVLGVLILGSCVSAVQAIQLHRYAPLASILLFLLLAMFEYSCSTAVLQIRITKLEPFENN